MERFCSTTMQEGEKFDQIIVDSRPHLTYGLNLRPIFSNQSVRTFLSSVGKHRSEDGIDCDWRGPYVRKERDPKSELLAVPVLCLLAHRIINSLEC